MLVAIDTFILEWIYTPIAWWFERRTGRTNFYLAWWAFGLSTACLVVYSDLKLMETHRVSWADILFAMSYLLITAIGMRQAQKKDAGVHRRPDTAVSSPDPIDVVARMVWLLLALLFLAYFALDPTRVLLFGALFFSLLMSGMYFSSVQRPPAKPREESESDLKPVPAQT